MHQEVHATLRIINVHESSSFNRGARGHLTGTLAGPLLELGGVKAGSIVEIDIWDTASDATYIVEQQHGILLDCPEVLRGAGGVYIWHYTHVAVFSCREGAEREFYVDLINGLRQRLEDIDDTMGGPSLFIPAIIRGKIVCFMTWRSEARYMAFNEDVLIPAAAGIIIAPETALRIIDMQCHSINIDASFPVF